MVISSKTVVPAEKGHVHVVKVRVRHHDAQASLLLNSERECVPQPSTLPPVGWTPPPKKHKKQEVKDVCLSGGRTPQFCDYDAELSTTVVEGKRLTKSGKTNATPVPTLHATRLENPGLCSVGGGILPKEPPRNTPILGVWWGVGNLTCYPLHTPVRTPV